MAMRAGAYHGLWWATASAEYRKKHWEGLDQHWDALRFYQAGQMHALVLTLSALFERRADTINLHKLSMDLGGVAGDIIRECSDKAVKVIKLRNHLFAHRSASLGIKEVYKLAAITSDDLKHLAEQVMEIVTQFCTALDMPQPAKPVGAIAAATSLLSALDRDGTALWREATHEGPYDDER
jgi:hypothetical protein